MPRQIRTELLDGGLGVRVTDYNTGHRLFDIYHNDFGVPDAGVKTRIWDVAVSRDGTYLATAGRDTTARLWDGTTGNLIRVVTAMEGRGDTSNHAHRGGYIWSVDFSPDGRLLATGGYMGEVLLWDTATAKLLAGLDEFGGATQDPPGLMVRFAEDGRSLTIALKDETKLVFRLPEAWWPLG